MHNIIFSIGDWSCDGHSCYAEYIVQSNKPLQELREIHFRENDFLGSLCSEYENNKVELLSFYNFLLRYNSLEKSQSIIKLLLLSLKYIALVVSKLTANGRVYVP